MRVLPLWLKRFFETRPSLPSSSVPIASVMRVRPLWLPLCAQFPTLCHLELGSNNISEALQSFVQHTLAHVTDLYL